MRVHQQLPEPPTPLVKWGRSRDQGAALRLILGCCRPCRWGFRSLCLCCIPRWFLFVIWDCRAAVSLRGGAGMD